MNNILNRRPRIALIFKVLLFLCLVLSVRPAGAQEFQFQPDRFFQRLQASTIVAAGGSATTYMNLVPTVSHAWWADMQANSTWYTKYKFKSISNVIRVGINHDTAVITANYNYRIALRIEGFLNPLSPTTATTKDITVYLKYNKDSLQQYNDLTAYKDTGAFHSMKVTVLGIYDSATSNLINRSTTLAKNFFIEVEVAAQRYVQNPQKLFVRSDYLTAAQTNGLKVKWRHYDTATTTMTCGTVITTDDYKPVKYELEWTYVDGYKLLSFQTGASAYLFNAAGFSVPYNFNNNATRIQTYENSFSIPMVYEYGALVYRVRTIRPDSLNYSKYVYSDWTLPVSGTLTNTGFNSSNQPPYRCLDNCLFIIDKPLSNDSLNWQHSVTFAEEGKYKNVLNYFDGSGHARQTQTRINSDPGYVIAADKIYDYEGRPAIQTLPIPVLSTNLAYKPNLTLNQATGLPYNAADFDKGCATDSIPPLHTTSLAYRYYSPLNTDMAGMQQFVPDAKGYPFIQTIFSPDNTNKVSWQGGAGADFQIFKGHATRNTYVRADQYELNRLMGAEVGKSQYYPKQVVTDPNGQSSFSIFNPSGDVVATALIGKSPDSTLMPIVPLANMATASTVTMNLLANLNQTVSNGLRLAEHNFFAEAGGTNKLHYGVSIPPYNPGCGAEYINVRGYYKYNLVNDCGVVAASDSNGVGTSGIVTSASAQSYSGPTLSTTLTSDKYTITKELYFPDSTIARLADSFTDRHTGINNCYVYQDSFIRRTVDAEIFPCPPGDTIGSCEERKKQMIAELYPGAKYGGYNKNPDGSFASGTANSIFTALTATSSSSLPPLPGPVEGGFYGENAYFKMPDANAPAAYSQWYWAMSGSSTWALCPTATFAVGANAYAPYLTPPDGAGSYQGIRGGPVSAPASTPPSFYVKTSIYVTDLNANNYTQLVLLAQNFGSISLFGVYVNGVLMAGSSQNYPHTHYVTLSGLQLGWNEIKVNVGTILGDPAYLQSSNGIAIKFIRGCYSCSNGETTTTYLRYQSDCTPLPNISWPAINNPTYSVIGPANDAPPDALIRNFNAQIAEALLPMHPEYCKLAFCSDDFDKKLSYISNYKEATAVGLNSLTAIMALDPLNQVNNPIGWTTWQLSHFAFDNNPVLNGANANLLRQLDTMSMEQAYCGCSAPEAYMYCKKKGYATQINSMLLDSDTIKDLYISKLIENYIANRNYLKQRAMDGASHCGPCDSVRMVVTGSPVFPRLFTGSGNDVVTDPSAPSWVNGVIEQGLDGTQLTTAPADITNAYNSSMTDRCKIQVSKIMEGLINCGLSVADSTNLSNNLINNYCTAGSNGSTITPDNVRAAMVAVSIPLSDLCGPFLAEYGLFDEQKQKERSAYAPKRQAFYTGLSTFLNRTEVKTALVTATSTGGTLYSALTLSTANEFERELSVLLGNATTANTRAYVVTITDGSYSRTYPVLVLKSGTYVDTLYFTRRNLNVQPAGCNNPFGNATPVTFQGATAAAIGFNNARNILDEPGVPGVSESLTAANMAYVNLTGLAGSTAACDNYAIWSRNIRMLKNRDPEALDYCINCAQMKTALDGYMVDSATYKYPVYASHPLFEDALTHYLNFKLEKDHTFEEYKRLMDGCAISDKVDVRDIRGTYQLVFSGASQETTAIQFVSALQASFSDISISNFRFKRSSTIVLWLDFNTVPKSRLRAVKAFVDASLAVPAGDKIYLPFAATFTAEVFIRANGACTPSFSTIPGATMVSESVQVKNALGTYVPYNWYRITNTGTTPLSNANVIQAVKDRLEGPLADCIQAYAVYNRGLYRSKDYSNTVKQGYLNYVYGLGAFSQDDISDTLAPTKLQANAGIADITAASKVSYQDPWCSNVKEDLYYYTTPGTAHAGLTKLNLIVDRVKTQLSTSLFPVAATTVVAPGTLGAGGTSLKAFKMGNGGTWYRLFDQQNRLFNVYLYPSEKMVGDPNTYKLVASSLDIIPGADSIYRFKVKLQKTISSVAHIVDCYGYTDFSIGTGKKLQNVVLYDHQNKKGCLDTMHCERQLMVAAIRSGIMLHARYIDSIKEAHFLAMRMHFPTKSVDTLLLTTQKQQYQYTLNYYDRAGNLSRTVPPGGVDTLSATNIALVDNNRINNVTGTLPLHKKVSYYRYNAMDQPIWQQTPDGGLTEFFYDNAGRLVFSQDAVQKPLKKYSYTLYDEQGRVSETGAVVPAATFSGPHPPLVANSGTTAMSYISAQVRLKAREDVVATFYDEALLSLSSNPGMSAQGNLRKRVSSILYIPFLALNNSAESYYAYGSHFSYDALGNIVTLTQDNPYMDYLGQRFKRIDYDYDLLSGKVNMVSYNRGKADQFYQKYDYDADNRITLAESSKDGLIWDRDAAYTYYKHGPLAQVQVGDLNVQSVQYAYTIQGWLKAINGDILRPEDDMGKDGVGGGLYPKDVLSHALGYHTGDYKQIGSTTATYTDVTNPLTKSLYNGNISRQATGLATLDNLQRNYQYDQLNRLKKTDYMKVNNDINHLVVAMASATAFRNAYIYDNDGNIRTLTRKNVSGVNIDSFTYNYLNPTANNKLDFVKDVAANTGGTDLPTGQLTGNYVYDAIGNLTKDVQGGIGTVRWNLYGKVTDIEMNSGNKVIHYDYDGSGNRVRKDVSLLDVNGNGKRESDLYVRDASGNILAVYKSNMGISGGLTIELVNQSIEDQHGSWTTPSGTGLTPFVVSTYGNNGQFSVPLIHEATSLNPTWSNSTSASLSLSQYLQLSDGIYAQATAEPLADYYNPMVTADVTIMTQTLFQGNQAAFMPLFMALLTDTKYAVKYGTLTHLCQQTPSLAQAMLTMLGQPVSGSYVTNATTMYNLITATGPANLMNAYQSKVGQFTPMPFYTVLCQDATILNKPWFVANPTIATGLGEGVYNSAPREEASIFFGGYLPGTWLASHSNLEERLNIVYNNNRGLFMDSYLTTIGVNALNSALHSIPQLTIGSYVQSVLQAVLIGTLNPTYQPPDVNTPDPSNITADTLYLAEHHLYGSSRLGIKTYDKGQYRAIYSGTLPAGIRDSSLNLQRVWYSGGFADWIKKDKTVPYNGTVFNISLDSFREVRRLGSKQYEMTDHLGNVLATVQDRKSGYGSVSGSYVGFNANLASVSDYYPGGFGIKERYKEFDDYRFGQGTQEKSDEVYGKGNLYTAQFWEYDTRLGPNGRWNPDPVTNPSVSPYATFDGNPIWKNDVLGNVPDFVEEKGGGIKWDKNANSQATTQSGETYLGKTLTFKFNSYIDGKLWDGPMGTLPAGNKLTSTIKITGNENSNGELTSISASKNVQLGPTPVGNARDYFPGLGGNQNKFKLTSSASGVNLNFEQHASVSPFEEKVLNGINFDIVNVAQKLNLNLSNNKLSISASTDVFPSATLSVNGKQLLKYNQPSFVKTHGQRISNAAESRSKGHSYTVRLRPAPAFHLRFQSNK